MRLASDKPFFGWWVAWTGFLMALFAWGLGFYGPGIYLLWLTRDHGWPVAGVSAAITLYYVASAAIVFCAGDIFARLGHRRAVLGGAAALGAGALAMPLLTAPWQAAAAFLVMAFGWAMLGSAGVNIVLAPWFERRRGMVVSLALNGASLGGVLIAPMIVLLAASFGTTAAMAIAVFLMLMTLGVFAVLTLGGGPAERGLAPDGDAPRAAPAAAAPRATRRALLGSWAFWSVAAPFALALQAQVAVLTHQLASLSLAMTATQAAPVIALTGVMAVAGRLATGLVVDRLDRRAVAAGNFALQACALVLLVLAGSPALLWAGWLLFGLGVGNQVTLSGLIVQVEFSRADFARVVGLVVAVAQVTYAFGPGAMGWFAAHGGYGQGFGAAAAVLVLAAAIVLAGRPRRWRGL